MKMLYFLHNNYFKHSRFEPKGGASLKQQNGKKNGNCEEEESQEQGRFGEGDEEGFVCMFKKMVALLQKLMKLSVILLQI